jgi:hypothetical protein
MVAEIAAVLASAEAIRHRRTRRAGNARRNSARIARPSSHYFQKQRVTTEKYFR